MVACNECRFAMPVLSDKFVCYAPVMAKNGKNIYPETFNILKKVGCFTAEKKA